MKLVKLYESAWAIGDATDEELAFFKQFGIELMEETDMASAEAIMDLFVSRKIGMYFDHVRTVPFNFGCRLLYHVTREFYSQFLNEPMRAVTEHWMTDDFRVYCLEDGTPKFYQHFVHGDCGSVWFTVEDD